VSEERGANCRFWLADERCEGICRRHAPHATFQGHLDDNADYPTHRIFPVTYRHDWCGEYQPKTTEVSTVGDY
jgi:hypothetical protein